MRVNPVVICIATLLSIVVMQASVASTAKPRVASNNVCADQLVMLLADPEQIVSLSRLAREEAGSVFYKQARQYPQNFSNAEEIYAQNPDFVITGQYVANYTPRMLTELGVTVKTLRVANSVQDSIDNIKLVAQWLEQPERGEELIAQMQTRLVKLPKLDTNRPRAASFGANGYTAGTKTLRGEAMELSGWKNVAEELGYENYGSLSLETLVTLWPDAMIESPYAAGSYSRAQWLTKHPAIAKSGLDPLKVQVPSNKSICGGPWSLDIVDSLIEARLAMPSNH